MYVYPSVFTDEMIDAIAQCEKVCKYIDIPLQHINDRVLKAMHRRVTRRETEDLLQRIRDRISGVSIRTTLIAGFPGETDAEFAELLDFITAFRFDALGVFPYSREPETPAGRMREQLDERVKQERVDALMRAQQDVAFALADEQVGRQFEVLVDESARGTATGRHHGQAPSVDSSTIVRSCGAAPGEFVTVRCVGRKDYDVVAQPTQLPLSVLRG
jgi:ribosomal protein S12 methylthiotransferase